MAETICIELDPELLREVDEYVHQRKMDRTQGLLQLLQEALQELKKREVIERYRKGEMTVRRCAEALGLSYVEADDLLHAQSGAVSPSTEEELREMLTEAQKIRWK